MRADGGARSSVFERVIAAVPLSAVFREALGEGALVRAGEGWKVCCPFHEDATPSLHLSDEKKVWHCFGCGASGNLFSFEKRVRGVATVGEALQGLAGRYAAVAEIVRESGGGGLGGGGSAGKARTEFPAVVEAAQPRTPRLGRRWGEELRGREASARVLRAADEYFCGERRASRRVAGYLGERGVDEETAARFGLGFAPDGMTGATDALRGMGFADDEMVLAGVSKRDAGGRVYDVFRDRVVVPIRDMGGGVVSFAGRLLAESETAPKYMNGVNSPLFVKRETLFGADVVAARDDCSALVEYGLVLLVEGYMDVLAVYQQSRGRVSAVACMGTAVSRAQVQAGLQLLGDRADGRLVVNLDGDDAGVAAAERLCETVLPGMTDVACVHIVSPPPGVKDVGEYFDSAAGSVDDYVRYVEDAALPWIEWRALRIIAEVVDARADALSEVQVVQAAELGSLGEEDEEEGEYWEPSLRNSRLSQTALMAEEVRLQSLKLLDSLSGDGEGGGGAQGGGGADSGGGAQGGGGADSGGGAQGAAGDKAARARKSRRAKTLVSANAAGKAQDARHGGECVANCPVDVLDRLASFMSKALRGSPGTNVPWLVHQWADMLSEGVSKRVPILYEAIMSRMDKSSQMWLPTSPAYLIDMMPPPPWVVEELPNSRRSKMQSSLGRTPTSTMGITDFLSDGKRRKQSEARIKAQARYLLPRLEEQRSEIALQMGSRPRASAEEIILRALLWANSSDRLDALDGCLAVMIDVEEAGLFPFWTSNPRKCLFEYLVDLEDDLSVPQMASACETQPWWTPDVELLFIPTSEYKDDELFMIRQVELTEPVVSVKQAAKCVAQMAKRVATGRAVEDLGRYMESQLGQAGAEGTKSDTLDDPGEVQRIIRAVSGAAYMTAAEREQQTQRVRAQEQERELALKIADWEDKLMRGEEIPYPWDDDESP